MGEVLKSWTSKKKKEEEDWAPIAPSCFLELLETDMWCGDLCGVMQVNIESVTPVFLASRNNIAIRNILTGVPNDKRVAQKREVRI